MYLGVLYGGFALFIVLVVYSVYLTVTYDMRNPP